MYNKKLVLKAMGLTDIENSVLKYPSFLIVSESKMNMTYKEVNIDDITILEIDEMEINGPEGLDDMIPEGYQKIGNLLPSFNPFFDGYLLAFIKKEV